MMRTNPKFDKEVTQIAINRGLSQAAVLCALLVAANQADTRKIALADYDSCLTELRQIPPDVAHSAAFNNLCQCAAITNYDVTPDEEREKHQSDCRYVTWRDLIGEPLESVLRDD